VWQPLTDAFFRVFGFELHPIDHVAHFPRPPLGVSGYAACRLRAV
jgi:hypothetical protein